MSMITVLQDSQQSGLVALISNNQTYDRLIVSAIIVVAAVVTDRLVRVLTSRWQRRVIKGIEKKSGDVAPVRTKFTIMGRVFTALIYLIALAVMLFQFDSLKSVATGLLGSAGLLAIVIGLAAQSTLSNFISGVFLSFSQPIRLNDSVIYANNWGWVEEISLTHTTIRTWDNRRIIVPNHIMADSVVENWTIHDSWLLGIVIMYVDYSCAVEKVRGWVREIVDGSKYSSEERVAVVQVVDFTEKCMVLRVLGRGADPANTWQLRCELREKLMERFHEAGLPLPVIRLSEGGDPSRTPFHHSGYGDHISG
ncbi:MAG: mechanosensitive ion channel family protein [Dehalococcoidia bacterium]